MGEGSAGCPDTGPALYARAFLCTESDEFDATYFLLHQLDGIRRSVDQLMAFLQRKMRETRETITLLRRTTLNHRQIALLTHALRHPDFEYTARSHALSHGVVDQSGRNDLMELEACGFLVKVARGRTHYYYPADDLEAKVQAS